MLNIITNPEILEENVRIYYNHLAYKDSQNKVRNPCKNEI